MALNTKYTALDTRSNNSLPFATIKYSATLAASTATSLVVPTVAGKFKAVIKAETDAVVWVSDSGTAAVPAGASFATVSSEMVPVNGELEREVFSGDTLSFITAGTDIDVSVVFYVLD